VSPGEHDEEEPLSDEEIASFAGFLDEIEENLSQYTEADHRAVLVRILRDANRLYEADELERGDPVGEGETHEPR
jgi:hypothetical protein